MVVIGAGGHLFPFMVTGSVVISDGGRSFVMVVIGAGNPN